MGPLFDLVKDEVVDADRVGDPGSKSPEAPPNTAPLGSVTIAIAGENGELPCASEPPLITCTSPFRHKQCVHPKQRPNLQL